MEEADKAAERSTLIRKFGRLLAPIHDLTEKPTPPTSTEYQVATARFEQDYHQWGAEVNQFVIVGGVTFRHAGHDITEGARDIINSLTRLARSAPSEPSAKQSELAAILRQSEKETLAAINQVPIEWAPRLLEEQTPFSTCLKIRDAIGTAKHRIHYFDRYLDSDFYDLYLRAIDRALEIRLVTTKGNKNYGIANVILISKLAAQEFANYQLIECTPTDIHDRNLRIDDMIFFLGTSINDAGKYPMNFSPGDSTPNSHNILDKILEKGMKVV
ncbi:MAG: hypothetical protein MN733_08020 [Nitrososphaera sp.]|nr:hypothetical protein [Nitrososphaera sp.]